jgi:hypothetical protein
VCHILTLNVSELLLPFYTDKKSFQFFNDGVTTGITRWRARLILKLTSALLFVDAEFDSYPVARGDIAAV